MISVKVLGILGCAYFEISDVVIISHEFALENQALSFDVELYNILDGLFDTCDLDLWRSRLNVYTGGIFSLIPIRILDFDSKLTLIHGLDSQRQHLWVCLLHLG